MSAATRRVERMNRHHRRHRTARRERWEHWADLISAHGLSIVSGPFPADAVGMVPLSPVDEEALRWEQARLGVLVDGILGPQSWQAVAAANAASMALDPSPRRRPGMAGAISVDRPKAWCPCGCDRIIGPCIVDRDPST